MQWTYSKWAFKIMLGLNIIFAIFISLLLPIINWIGDNILHTTEVYEALLTQDASPTEYLLKSKEILLPIEKCTYRSIINNDSWYIDGCIDKENPLNIKEAYLFVDGFLEAWGEIKENTRHGLWHMTMKGEFQSLSKRWKMRTEMENHINLYS